MGSETASLRLGVIVLAASLCAIALFAVLTALAKPADFAARRVALARQVTELERLSKTPAPAGDYGGRAVCPSLDAAELAAIRGSILNAAGPGGAPGGVKLAYLSTDLPSSASGRIAPVSVQLRAEGPYDALSTFIDRMAAGQPALFIDRLDLVASQPDVVLKLTGKVFCWNSARP